MLPEDNNPQVPPTNEPPKQDDVPSWAQQLIDQNADLTSRLESFEEKINPPAPTPEPQPDPVADEWKPSSWQDVDARAEEKARSIVEQTLAEREASVKTQQEEAEKAAAEVDKYLDNQVEELTKDSKLPSVTNENDPNDPGKLAQRELYGFALSLGTADLKSSYETLDALHKSGKKFDFVNMKLVDSNPALEGMNSPVGSSNSGSSGTSNKIDYKTIHNNSLTALADRFSQSV